MESEIVVRGLSPRKTGSCVLGNAGIANGRIFIRMCQVPMLKRVSAGMRETGKVRQEKIAGVTVQNLVEISKIQIYLMKPMLFYAEL